MPLLWTLSGNRDVDRSAVRRQAAAGSASAASSVSTKAWRSTTFIVSGRPSAFTQRNTSVDESPGEEAYV